MISQQTAWAACLSELNYSLPVNAAGRGSTAFSRNPASAELQRWLDRCKVWSQTPSAEDEDGYISPALPAIQTGVGLLRWLDDQQLPLPTMLVENGDGGIGLRLETESLTEELLIDEAGGIEYLQFSDARLTARSVVQLTA